jgi:ABC-type branched-subunit amino acid transport system substrate-binding protein
VIWLSKTISVFKQENILRYPRLDTVLMVEEAIQKAEEYPSKAQLLRSLPKKMMYQTFCTIIDYLEYSGKIYLDKDGAIIWIWDPEAVRKIMANPKLVVR